MAHSAVSPMLMTLTDAFASDRDDFDSVVRTYQPKIFRFALASLRDRDAAQSITQDCFLKAFKAREKFRHECSVDTWLMQIVINLIRDHSRTRMFRFWNRMQTGTDAEELANWTDDRQRSPETGTLLKERVQSVWIAAARLPERQTTVFLLRFVEDMDLLEIAQVTGMKESTVKTHLFRALKTVRAQTEQAK